MKGNCGECEYRWFCEIDPGECDAWTDPTPMTNGDHIRSMSDEELADFLAYTWATSARAWQKDPGETLHWLQQPAEGE